RSRDHDTGVHQIKESSVVIGPWTVAAGDGKIHRFDVAMQEDAVDTGGDVGRRTTAGRADFVHPHVGAGRDALNLGTGRRNRTGRNNIAAGGATRMGSVAVRVIWTGTIAKARSIGGGAVQRA